MANPPDSKKREPRHFHDGRATVPSALELTSNTAWAEFERLQEDFASGKITVGGERKVPSDPHAPAFAPTQAGAPAPLAQPAARPAAALSAADVMVEARRYNRVCPKPEAWQRLYELLPNKITRPIARPAPPISGAAWNATSAMPKRMCLREHIEWAEQHGALEQVMQFLQSLPEAQWHHMDD